MGTEEEQERKRIKEYKQLFYCEGWARRRDNANDDTLFTIPPPPPGVKKFKKNKEAMKRWEQYIKNRELLRTEEEKNDTN